MIDNFDKRFVEEYKKIKPSENLKARIMIGITEAQSEKAPLYKRLKPLMSGMLACLVLVVCVAVMPMDMLGKGQVSVAYTQSGEVIAPASVEGRAYAIAAYEETLYPYTELPDGLYGAEFTFDFEGKTEINTEFGSVYLRNADGEYEKIESGSRIDKEATIFWAMPNEEFDGFSVMTLKNRTGEWMLVLEPYVDAYKANFFRTE